MRRNLLLLLLWLAGLLAVDAQTWNQENFQQGIGDESWICGSLDESHSNGVIAAPKCDKTTCETSVLTEHKPRLAE